MSDTYLPSTIESLPTELWCEVSEFFDANELYYTFGNLNSKITAILFGNTSLYFTIATMREYNFSSREILPLVDNLAIVKSFKFYQEFQIEEFFTRWSISEFNQLRRLSLVYLGALMSDCSISLLEQLSILTHFECLQIQVGTIVHYDQCLKRLFQLIFVKNNVFLSLKHFALQSNNDCYRLLLPAPAKQTKLEFIALTSLYFDEFVQLLPSIPLIKSIKTNWLSKRIGGATVVTTPAKRALPNCLHLNLQLGNDLIFEDIQFLLQQVPQVKQLQLICTYNLLDNVKKWEKLLTEDCSKLQKILFISSYRHIYPLPIFNELQNSFSTPFWLERNVQFEHSEKSRQIIIRFKI